MPRARDRRGCGSLRRLTENEDGTAIIHDDINVSLFSCCRKREYVPGPRRPRRPRRTSILEGTRSHDESPRPTHLVRHRNQGAAQRRSQPGGAPGALEVQEGVQDGEPLVDRAEVRASRRRDAAGGARARGLTPGTPRASVRGSSVQCGRVAVDDGQPADIADVAATQARAQGRRLDQGRRRRRRRGGRRQGGQGEAGRRDARRRTHCQAVGAQPVVRRGQVLRAPLLPVAY